MNKRPIFKENITPKPIKQPLSEETVRALQELGEVFRQIHRRLVSEGYVIKDGKIFPPKPKDDGATK